MTNTPKPEALKGCPFCNAELEKPSPAKFPKSGLARMHPGTIDDGSCPIAGWGFYDEQLAAWNTRASAVPVKNEALASLVNELMFPANWRARKVGIASDLYDSDAPFRAATTITTLAAERDALMEALAECRRAVSGGKSNPRQTVRNIVDMAIEERGRCTTLERTAP